MAKSKKRPAKRKPPAKRAAPRARPAAKPKARGAAVKRGIHDLGGLPGGPIDRAPHTMTPFEERVDAMMMVLSNQLGLYKVDAMRRTVESMSAKEYRDLAYYERWMLGIRRMLVEQGVLSDVEIDAKVAEIEASLGVGQAR